MGFGFPTAPTIPPAGSVTYTPTTPADWSPAPTEVGGALDQLADRVTTLEASAPQPQIWACPMAAAVRQAVYQSGDGAVDVADASDPTKMPVLGFIASKPTATSCVLQDEDELGGFAGLTPDTVYYADPAVPGGITTQQPTLPADAGKVAQQVGTAKSATVLTVRISGNPPVYL